MVRNINAPKKVSMLFTKIGMQLKLTPPQNNNSGIQKEAMFRFSIYRGGTFTDVYAECPGGEVKVMKLLSEDPNNYSDAPREAIRRIMEEVGSFEKLYE